MKASRLVLSIVLITLLAGCASAPKVMNMVPVVDSSTFVNKDKTLKISMVYGGEESDPIIKGSRIDNASFMEAVIQALTNSNLFTKINPTDQPDLVLTPEIHSQDQPILGFNMTATLLVRYILKNGADGTQIWTKDIISKYTATVGEAFVGATRLKKANEGAVRENIKSLIDELAKLEL